MLRLKQKIRYNYDMGYWARRLNTSINNLAEAIRNTGTTEIKILKTYLEKQKILV